MSALTIRLADEKYRRLKSLARAKSTSVNRLFDEMATRMLAEFDIEAHFQLRAARGEGKKIRAMESENSGNQAN